jgi:hypothetical protein
VARMGAENRVDLGGVALYGWHNPLIGSLLHPADSDTGDMMMLSLYVALGIFLLIAARNPSAHRSLIAFAAWSSFAHSVAMSILGLEIASQRVGFLVGSAVLVVIGVALIALAGEISCAGICNRCVASQSGRMLTPASPSWRKNKPGAAGITNVAFKDCRKSWTS